MSEIVKCANRKCGLITELSNWRQVPTENPRISKGHCPRCNGKTFYEAKTGEVEKIKSGAQLISLERLRQINIEGWTAKHDEAHSHGQLCSAAAAYQLQALLGFFTEVPPPMWPFERKWWKPTNDPVRNLTKAGALIAAEIDRLQRASKKSK